MFKCRLILSTPTPAQAGVLLLWPFVIGATLWLLDQPQAPGVALRRLGAILVVLLWFTGMNAWNGARGLFVGRDDYQHELLPARTREWSDVVHRTLGCFASFLWLNLWSGANDPWEPPAPGEVVHTPSVLAEHPAFGLVLFALLFSLGFSFLYLLHDDESDREKEKAKQRRKREQRGEPEPVIYRPAIPVRRRNDPEDPRRTTPALVSQ